MKRLVPIALALCCGGCFSSNGSLYDNTKPLTPFRVGVVTTHDSDGKNGHLALELEKDGVYRFTVSDRGEDFGEGYRLRFFALPGAPSGTLTFEALELCKPPDRSCKPATATSPRLYGLVRLTANGAEEIIPDCDKTSPLAKWRGVVREDYDTCRFADRATLEKALLTVANSKPKADTVYSYQP